MKKIARILIAVLCALTVFSFAACSDAGAPDHSVSSPDYAVAPSALSGILKDFLETNPDRTSFKNGEEQAALYLSGKLTSYGYNAKILDAEDLTENEVSGLSTRHVVATKPAAPNVDKPSNVIIGAYYDNRCSEAYAKASFTGAEGALSNGTGVATLLGIAECVSSLSFDFDITFVFFGGSYVSSVGANSYYDLMSAEERARTALMIELQRIGCDHVYAFSDERETKREPFFSSVAQKHGLDVYKVTQKSPLILDISGLPGVPYYRWAHTGIFAPFFAAGIPTLNIVGANWESIDMSDRESNTHANISGTKNDTLENLESLYPDYAKKMATAASLVVHSLQTPGFIKTMKSDRENFPDTSVLTKSWIWYLITLGILLVAAGIVFGISMHLAKKYPVAPPAPPKKIKMAVFGMDYEDKNSDNIYVDIKNADDDIFPGVPNNKTHADPFDGIFKSAPSDKPEADQTKPDKPDDSDHPDNSEE